MGGNNPRIETEVIKGDKDSEYSINDRSTKEYSLSSDSKSLLKGTFDIDKKIELIYESNLVEFYVNHTNVTDDKILGVDRYEGYVGEKQIIKAREFEGFKPNQQTKTVTISKGMNDIVFPYDRTEEGFIPVEKVQFVHRAIGTTTDTPTIRIPIVVTPLNASDKGVTFELLDSKGDNIVVYKSGLVGGLNKVGNYAEVKVTHNDNKGLFDICKVQCTDKEYPITYFNLLTPTTLTTGEYHKLVFSYEPSMTSERDFSFMSDKGIPDIDLVQGAYAIRHNKAEDMLLTVRSQNNQELKREFKLTFVDKED